jgi:hypothetical protein
MCPTEWNKKHMCSAEWKKEHRCAPLNGRTQIEDILKTLKKLCGTKRR